MEIRNKKTGARFVLLQELDDGYLILHPAGRDEIIVAKQDYEKIDLEGEEKERLWRIQASENRIFINRMFEEECYFPVGGYKAFLTLRQSLKILFGIVEITEEEGVLYLSERLHNQKVIATISIRGLPKISSLKEEIDLKADIFLKLFDVFIQCSNHQLDDMEYLKKVFQSAISS